MTAPKLNPYLHFRDNARAAIEFYQYVFGGDCAAITFGEFDQVRGSAQADLIMHAQLETDAGFTLMVADVPAGSGYSLVPNGSISLSGEDHVLLTEYFTKLSQGGAVTQRLDRAPWGGYFGMLTDRFGVT